ncbi:type II toxin-antitoxin system PemK/MazF family toxin [Deinococcus sp.]|uniref:type II toxin-antitoxin system PemK/MazF family toxin n=1 Tax=Deinococcus sp. TaxID=47478 RepID=UPI0025F7A8BD|nr:type II toxin-antitoxin system PemK/MazF family toxin [Deinococcus sp.]
MVVPKKGDLIWLNPQARHEQAGRRPALALTNSMFHSATGLLFACPVTSRVRGLPFEVPLPPGLSIGGVILVHHARSVDWRARQAEVIEAVPEETLFQVLDILNAVTEAVE